MGASEIVASCREEGISIVAVTDHNHVGNVQALRRASSVANEAGENSVPIVLFGIEVQSIEDIHVVLIFSGHDTAAAFQEWLWLKMPPILNNINVFGYQFVIDHENNIIDQVPILLTQAAQYSIDEIAKHGMDAGALVIPAHLDRTDFSYEAALGQLPESFPCSAIEISPVVSHADLLRWKKRYPDRVIIRSSDSHNVSNISRSRCTLMLLAEPSFDEIKLALQNSMGRKVLFP